MAEVPLADERGRVVGLQGFGDGDFGQWKSVFIGLADDVFCEARADWVAACEQAGAGGGADAGGRVELCELRAFRRHAIEVRRADGACAIDAEVAIAKIIGEDDDDVGLARGDAAELRRGAGGERRESDGAEEEVAAVHAKALRVEIQFQAGAGPAAFVEFAGA